MTILPIELAKSISQNETGLLIFQNKDGEVIRVFLRNGEIIKVDGLYGEGESEIARLFLWGEGTVIKRKLPKEYENFYPPTRYNINGFLKILVESIKKERQMKEIEKSLNESFLKALLGFLENSYAFLNYSKDDWIGFLKLIERLSKSIKNSIILISKKYVLFFGKDIEFIISREGYVNFEKIEEENLFEPFDYQVFLFSPNEYERLIIPFTKEPDYKGAFNNLNLNDFSIGLFYNEKQTLLYVKDLNEIEPPNNAKCLLWK